MEKRSIRPLFVYGVILVLLEIPFLLRLIMKQISEKLKYPIQPL